MCYWVGTKNVREALLKRAGKQKEPEVSQLFYRDLFTQDSLPEFHAYWVAIGKSKPPLTTLISTGDSVATRTMQWTLPVAYTDNRTGKTESRELLNIMSEKLWSHSVYKPLQTCVVPIDGYFEYYHQGREVFPHFIRPAQGEVFFAGALYRPALASAQPGMQECMALLTTTPNKLTRKLHNNPSAPNGSRMLVLFTDETRAIEFLRTDTSSEAMGKLLAPLPDDAMEAYPVARFQRKEFQPFIDTERVRQQVNYTELSPEKLTGRLLF